MIKKKLKIFDILKKRKEKKYRVDIKNKKERVIELKKRAKKRLLNYKLGRKQCETPILY